MEQAEKLQLVDVEVADGLQQGQLGQHLRGGRRNQGPDPNIQHPTIPNLCSILSLIFVNRVLLCYSSEDKVIPILRNQIQTKTGSYER